MGKNVWRTPCLSRIFKFHIKLVLLMNNPVCTLHFYSIFVILILYYHLLILCWEREKVLVRISVSPLFLGVWTSSLNNKSDSWRERKWIKFDWTLNSKTRKTTKKIMSFLKGLVSVWANRRRIFVFGSVWEFTEYSDRKPRKETPVWNTICVFCVIFLFGKCKTQWWMVPRIEKVFWIVPRNSTLVRKDGVTPISSCD